MGANDPIEILQTEQFRGCLAGLKDLSARAIIIRRIDRVRLGNLGDYKSVGDNVLELRIFFGPAYRVYLTWSGKNIITLLCGGSKGSQISDIVKAKLLAAQDENGEAHEPNEV